MRKLLRNLVLLFTLCAPALVAQDYNMPATIQEGTILHCFDWPVADVRKALPDIAAAGFGAVQISPVQRPDARSGEYWHALYRPYDLAFKSSSYCSENDLRGLCTDAHSYGIKVIVDVVANHVDKTAGYHDTWWDSNGRVRFNGGINYGDRYSITHGQLGDYGDLNSEDPEVIARAKSFIQSLHDMGVDGIRWDAAKHIGLPSEGCNFWSEVTSIEGMYHYGEILNEPGPNSSIITEYAKYMSVTDNRYSNYAAKDNGGVPNNAAGEWINNQHLSPSKLVYWAESHDTYSNDEWSQSRSQDVIDRAYAAYAARQGVTVLYFSRPNTTGFSNIKVGKGSTHFTATEVAAVNRFHNIMGSRRDAFQSDGSKCVITRENGGAVIVMKGSGQVSMSNVNGYCPAGTYTDRVSGNRFTVTSSTISGNVGSSGIAVIYSDELDPNPGPTPDPDPEPDPLPDPEPAPDGQVVIYFDNSASNWSTVNFYIYGGSKNEYNDFVGGWPGKPMTYNNDSGLWVGTFEADFDYTALNIIFNNNAGGQTGDNVKVRHNGIYNKDGDTGRSSAIDFEADLSAPVEYFNLQGMPVSEPANGVFIRRQGTNVSKLFIP